MAGKGCMRRNKADMAEVICSRYWLAWAVTSSSLILERMSTQQNGSFGTNQATRQLKFRNQRKA